jgi:hypothetical protein
MTDIKISLIDIDGLSEPSKVLIEKVSEAVGEIFKPYQIERIAKAETNAMLTKTKAEIEATELQQRALKRFLSEEALKQVNMENITRKAIPLLDEKAQPNNIEKDWLIDFFDKSRLISNENMQDLWAKILAGEANIPGTYAKRTLHLMATLDKNDAQIFTNLCAFLWYINGPLIIVFDEQAEIYTKNNISFTILKHLDSIGLISFEPLAGYKRMKFSKTNTASYFSKTITLEFQNESDNDLNTGKVMLTEAGLQLINICNSKQIDGFVDYTLAEWAKLNIKSI